MSPITANRPIDELDEAYLAAGADGLSDVELVRLVARTVQVPRRDPADSFVLHAPLELAARAALLPYTDEARRGPARRNIFAVGLGIAAHAPAAPPRPGRFDSPGRAAARLRDAIDAGDLDGVDTAASWLGRVARAAELRQLLADVIVPRLSAAAHGSIFLYQLPRVAPRGELPGELLRPLARELARYPDWVLGWPEQERDSRPQPDGTLLEAIQATPSLGLPGSDFIFPIMSQVDDSGVASELLRGPTAVIDFDEGARTVLRAAAWSMLQEAGSRPYGWTHCLTLPQAVLGIAHACREPGRALAVAATYVVGFRAALASAPLEASYDPPHPGVGLASALATSPETAAAAVWHAPSEALAPIVRELASRASAHHDAHYVKYTLACLDAAERDPSHSKLYLAAAGCLAGYWSTADAGPA